MTFYEFTYIHDRVVYWFFIEAVNLNLKGLYPKVITPFALKTRYSQYKQNQMH